MRSLRFAAVLLCLAPGRAPADISPEGRWTVLSDTDQRPVAIMRIYEENGEYRGKIDELLSPSDGQAGPVCDHCRGSLKGEPIKGLVLMHGLKRNGNRYTGGRILDPESGKYYRLQMKVAPDGNTLVVRGYLGMSLLGRTQTWRRVRQ